MNPRQLFVLAALLALGALVSAAVPKHPLFNQPAGPTVLGGMALLCAAAGLVAWVRGRNSRGGETVG